jgi:hypothetical protein
MKTPIATIALFISIFTNAFAQSPRPLPAQPGNLRVSFMLKNTLGYHRMFLAQGPGIAYGFTMNKRETTPKNWPVGTNLYFSQDGETPGERILTVTADDEGKTLTTGTVTPNETPRKDASHASSNETKVAFKLHNTSFLPKRIALISYEPGKGGNGTSIFPIAPKGNAQFTFPVGTKLYIANSEQVDIVMSGKRIDNGKPFHVVRQEDAGKVINLE